MLPVVEGENGEEEACAGRFMVSSPTSALLSTQIILDRFSVVGGTRVECPPCVADALEYSAVTTLA